MWAKIYFSERWRNCWYIWLGLIRIRIYPQWSDPPSPETVQMNQTSSTLYKCNWSGTQCCRSRPFLNGSGSGACFSLWYGSDYLIRIQILTVSKRPESVLFIYVRLIFLVSMSARSHLDLGNWYGFEQTWIRNTSVTSSWFQIFCQGIYFYFYFY